METGNQNLCRWILIFGPNQSTCFSHFATCFLAAIVHKTPCYFYLYWNDSQKAGTTCLELQTLYFMPLLFSDLIPLQFLYFFSRFNSNVVNVKIQSPLVCCFGPNIYILILFPSFGIDKMHIHINSMVLIFRNVGLNAFSRQKYIKESYHVGKENGDLISLPQMHLQPVGVSSADLRTYTTQQINHLLVQGVVTALSSSH